MKNKQKIWIWDISFQNLKQASDDLYINLRQSA